MDHDDQEVSDTSVFVINTKQLQQNDANMLALHGKSGAMLLKPPVLTSHGDDGMRSLSLAGRWQSRSGSGDQHADLALPAKFGASTDIVISPAEELWVARPVTLPHMFTPGVEGPACDVAGNVFAVNLLSQGTIGKVNPQGSAEVFVTLPPGSVGNGIRFHGTDRFYVADYPKHNVLKVNMKTRQVSLFAHEDRMNQPNDLAIAPDGTLYASDPSWDTGTGQLWRIDVDGTVTQLASEMGTTNGIDVSPDGKTLYVNESVQRNVWAFDIGADHLLSNKRLIRQFADHGFDGMRCDVDGNLYITRFGKGTVVKMTPEGEILQEVSVLGTRPSNLCFGGPDGRTVYVTEVDGGRLVAFRVDRPGRSWSESQAR